MSEALELPAIGVCIVNSPHITGEITHVNIRFKGPAVFLAQFAGDANAPFNTLASGIARWAAGHGLRGRANPDHRTSACLTWQKAAESQTYCDEVQGAR